MLSVLFLILLLVGGASIIYFTLRNGISPMPTTKPVLEPLMRSLPTTLKGTLIELGSGWGSLAFPLAKRYPNCMVVAYENSWIPYLYCRLRLWFFPCPNLNFIRADFYDASLASASLIVCYLFPGAMEKLKGKFEKELSPGCLVVSHTFAVPGWTPLFTDSANDLYHTPLYHYKR